MRRSGARAFTFDIDTGEGSLLPAGDKPIDFGELESAVRDSGFGLLWIEARVRGTLRTVSDPSGAERPALVVEDPRQTFLLVEGTTEEEREAYRRLRGFAEGREPRIQVRGRVHVPVEDVPVLTVLDVRKVP